jgi:YbgC/YbaW family acyl-CoA thioester hydrolase
LKNRPITFKHRWQVRLADTDASGVAHFSSYVRMMEEAEYAFLRSRGLSVVLPNERGTLGFPRLQASIEVHQPLVFEQTVEIHLQLLELDGKQIVYEFEIVDDGDTGNDLEDDRELPAANSRSPQPLVKGRFVVVCCRFPEGEDPYAVLLPDGVVEALESSL